MTQFERGDVFLVLFPFTDKAEAKQRPVLVISSEEYHRERHEVIVAAITSRTDQIYYGDHVLQHWKKAGLLLPSMVTGIIRTVKNNALMRRLGRLADSDLKGAEIRLRSSLCL